MTHQHESELPGHQWIPEPSLLFHPERHTDVHVHPLKGLLQYGAYSRSLLNPFMDPIRVASIGPAGWRRRVDGLVEELRSAQEPRERRAYLPQYPGFSSLFGVGLVTANAHLQVELPADTEQQLANSPQPVLKLGELLSRAVRGLEARRSEFNVVIVLLPEEWATAFEDKENDLDLHDYLKADTASRGIPCQFINDTPNGALQYRCRASVGWRLGIALYTKAGGVPWKLATTGVDTAFIGISYAMQPLEGAETRFVTCCSQVFDADGAGLEFITYQPRDVRIERRNPFLDRTEMRRVIARSLELFQRRHGGRLPSRVVVHKSTEFKDGEVSGCGDALAAVDDVRLLHVQIDVFWRGTKLEARRRPAAYPCERGTLLQLGAREALLWTQGNVAEALGKNYYKEGKSIPSPLLLTRYAGHGPMLEDAGDVLALTKMNWNNDNLYDREPATLAYAGVLARTVRRMPDLLPRPYQLRFFM